MTQLHHILFIELLGGIGDVVIALPAIHALARSHVQAHITVLTFAPAAELLQTDPLIAQVVVAKRGEARQSVEELLKAQTFDLIVSDTNYDGIGDLIQASAAPFKVTNLWRSPPSDQRVGDRFLTLLLQDGWITLESIHQPSTLHLNPSALKTSQAQLGALYRPLMVLCPDAGMSIKRWSSDRFVELGKRLLSQVGGSIVVPVGADAAQATEIVEKIGDQAQVWQRGSLRQIAAVLAQADLMIASDTGLARIAAALHTPTITLFGPSWQGRYGQPSPHLNLQGFPDCPERNIHNFTEQACWYSGNCPFEWATCLDDISVEQVQEAAIQLLSRPQPRRTIDLPLTSLESEWHKVKNLLVMRLDNIGDVMMTSPVLRSLRENLPDAKITLMASPGGSQTAELLPWIDKVLPWRVLWQDLGRLAFDPMREWELVDTLRQHQFDAAIILTSFSQSPHPPALICALAGIPLRLGESKETDLGTLTHAIPPAPDEIHQVDRNLRLIESVGFHISDRRLCLSVSQSIQNQIHQRLQIEFNSSDPAYLLLNPWTSCQSRNYDPDRFAIAARELSQITGWKVIITGVEKDRQRSDSILQILGDRAIDWMGTTTLPELVALVAKAKLVLTNNTSTMHVADAVNVPNIILFAGTEQEEQWCPRYSLSRVLRRSTVCSPCYAFACPYELQCLDIEPEVIVKAGLELLKQALSFDSG